MNENIIFHVDYGCPPLGHGTISMPDDTVIDVPYSENYSAMTYNAIDECDFFVKLFDEHKITHVIDAESDLHQGYDDPFRHIPANDWLRPIKNAADKRAVNGPDANERGIVRHHVLDNGAIEMDMVVFRYMDFDNVVIELWKRDLKTREWAYFTELVLYPNSDRDASEARHYITLYDANGPRYGYYDFGEGTLIPLREQVEGAKRVLAESETNGFKPIPEDKLDGFVEDHLNAMIGAVQNDMNQYDGGLASVFFDGPNWNTMKRIMTEYIKYEMNVDASHKRGE